MPVKAKTVFRRWFHHRTRSEYRELASDTQKLLPEKLDDWKTVPGLVVDDDDTYLSTEDSSQGGHSIDDSRNENHGQRDWGRRGSYFPSEAEGEVGGEEEEEKEDDMQEVVQRLSRSRSVETAFEAEPREPLEPSTCGTKRQPKSIRWADLEGQTLVVRHDIETLSPLHIRIVILMLNTSEKIFEFVQCEFQADERLSVSDLLVQIPFLASMEALRKQRYSGLYRGDREMVNIIGLQDYDVCEGEILVAVAAGTNPRHSIAAAAALLLQRNLLRAVQKAKLSGRALQKLLSSAELDAVLEGAIPDIKRFDEEDDSRGDDCRLVLKVLNRELGISSPRRKSAPERVDDDDDDDESDDPDEEGAFPFISVPDLEDKEFLLFRQVATIDPYSPVARGRMAELPRQLLGDSVHFFEPPFGDDMENDNDCWDEISSDDEYFDDFEPELIERMPSVVKQDVSEYNVDPGEQQHNIDDYIGAMTAFSDVSDTDDEADVDASEYMTNVSLENHENPESFSSESSPEEENPAEDVDDISSSNDDFGLLDAMELEPIPDITYIDENDDDEYSPDISSTTSIDQQTFRSLSHISEADTLEENDDDVSDPSPVVSITAQMCSFDIPDIDSLSTNESDERMKEFLNMSRSSHESMAQEASALFMAVALLVGAVDKISSRKGQPNQHQSRLQVVEEAEV